MILVLSGPKISQHAAVCAGLRRQMLRQPAIGCPHPRGVRYLELFNPLRQRRHSHARRTKKSATGCPNAGPINSFHDYLSLSASRDSVAGREDTVGVPKQLLHKTTEYCQPMFISNLLLIIFINDPQI